MIAIDTLRDLDLKHLWHPYTDTNAYAGGPFTCIERAQGVYLYDAEGRAILDGISSWWAAALGHGHPALVEAIREQAGTLQHSILGNMTHPKAIELAAQLAEITPAGLNHAYFASDGASATEAALKIAIQYWSNLGLQGKTEFVALADGYHGDTLGAVGVGFVPQFHQCFEGAVRRAHTAESPHCPCCSFEQEDGHCAMKAFESMKRLVEEHHPRLAGIILEPLCQCAAGIRIYPAAYLRAARALCDQYGLLLLADEIAVGFGRTGDLFACVTAGITPDILCLGKALTGGYLPMSVAMVNSRVYESFRSGDGHDRTFYDGHTFCGNPITSAVSLAALEVYASEDIVTACRPRARELHRGMVEIGDYDCVAYHKSLGMIAMCAFSEAAGGAVFAKRVAGRALDLGLFVRPLGEVLYLWPPLVTSAEELAGMLSRFKAAIEHCESE